MKYLICFFVLSVFGGAVFFWQRQKKHISSAFLKAFLLGKYHGKTNSFFSLFADEIIEMAAYAISNAPYRVRKQIFASLKQGDEKPFFAYLQAKEPPIFALLDSFLSDKPYKSPKNSAHASDFSKLADLLAFESQFEYNFKKKPPKNGYFLSGSKNLHQLKKLFDARRLFLKTDLKKASQTLIKLTRFYQKENNMLKTAYVYFMLGQIYRLAKAFDTAYIMFDKALFIYTQKKHIFGKHLVLTALGFNSLSQSNFDEAQAYFKEAYRFFGKTKDLSFQAKILTGRSCCFLAANNFGKAHTAADKAYLIHKKNADKAAMAYTLELKAAAQSGTFKHQKAAFYANTALKHYRQTNNLIGQLKMYYMLATIYYDAGQIENAKKSYKAFTRHKNKHNLAFTEEKAPLKEMLLSKKTRKVTDF